MKRLCLRTLCAFLTIAFGCANAASEPTFPRFDLMAPDELNETIEIFDEMLVLDPDDSDVRLQRSFAYMAKKEFRKSIEDSDVVIRQNSDLLTAYLLRAQSKYRLNKIEQAAVDYDHAIRLDPANSNAYSERGAFLAANGESDLAFKDFSTAIRLDPKNAAAFRYRGEYWCNRRESSKALADFDEAIRLNPNDPEAYVCRGLQRAIRRKWDDALADLDKTVLLNPYNADSYFQRALIFSSKQDRERAIADLDMAIQFDPRHHMWRLCRGYQLMMGGDLDAAIDNCNDVLKLDPHNADTYWFRVILRWHRREYSKALLDALTTDELNPRLLSYDDFELLGKEVLRSAQAKLTKHIEVTDHSRDAAAYRERGIANFALERWDEAMNDFDEAIQRDQSSSLAYKFRGRLWMHRRDWDRAIDDFNSAFQFNQNDPSVWSDRGKARSEKGEWAVAIDDYTAAIQLDSLDKRTVAQRGVAWQSLGDIERAIIDYNEAIADGPFYVNVSLDRLKYEGTPTPQTSATLQVTINSKPAFEGPTSLFVFEQNRIPGLGNGATGGIPADTGTSPQTGQSATTSIPANQPAQPARKWHGVCLDPFYLKAFRSRAVCHEMNGEWAKALVDLEELTRLAPSSKNTYGRIAWLLATCPDPNIRNGAEAVEYATKATQLNPTVKDYVVLAAAYAEMKEYEKAIDFQTLAIEHAREKCDKDFLDRRQLLKSLDFGKSIETDTNQTTEPNLGLIESALKACEDSSWNDAKSVEYLIKACRDAGQFDSAVEYLDKLYALTLEAQNRELREMLEIYRSGQPFRSTGVGIPVQDNSQEDGDIVSNPEFHAQDEVLFLHGMPVRQLSVTQIRLLSIDPKSEPISKETQPSGVSNAIE